MRKINFLETATEELLDLYVRLSVEQGQATCVSNTVKINQLGKILHEISNEIKRRPSDRGRSMLMLFNHPNTQVRFNAATSVSGVFSLEARQVIQIIADSEDMLAFNAKMYLRTLDDWMRKHEL